MSRLRDAISQVPSKPAFIMAVVVGLGLATWYYGTTWQRCSELRQSREALQTALKTAAESDAKLFSFSRLAGLENVAEIRLDRAVKPGQVPLHCPFGWDMGWRERQKLIEADKYTIIGLFDAKGTFQRYIEWREDLADFAKLPKTFPVDAPLSVNLPEETGGAYVLRPIP